MSYERKLKPSILFILPDSPLYRIGGFETITRYFAEELAEKGCKVYVLGRGILGVFNVKVINKVIYLEYGRAKLEYKTPKLSLKYILTVLKDIIEKAILLILLHRRKNIEIVVFYREPYIYAPLAFLCRLLNICTVLAYVVIRKASSNFLVNIIRKIVFSMYSLIMIYTLKYYKTDGSVIDNLKELRKYHNYVVYLPPGLRPERVTKHFEDYQNIKRLRENNYIVVCPRRLTYQKGVHVLLEAIPFVIKNIKNVIFIFVGSGELKPYLIKRMKDLKIENHVMFLGAIPYNKVLSPLKNADVVVVPSLTEEDFGMIFLEAFYAGCAIVSTKLGGIPNVVIEGKGGILVKPNDTLALAKAIIYLLKNDSLRNIFREFNYNRLKSEFNLSLNADKLLRYLSYLVKKTPIHRF